MLPDDGSKPFWSFSADRAYARLDASPGGLTQDEAKARLARVGPNSDRTSRRRGSIEAIAKRVLEPLVLLLIGAAVVSAATGDAPSALIIVVIVAFSIALDTVQEARANKAAEALQKSLAPRAEVLRNGVYIALPAQDVVPGDIIRVRTGDIVPADALVLEASSFSANEAALTGEPYPAAKTPGVVTAASPAEASNALFRGSVAETGEAVGLVMNTGAETEFGAIASLVSKDEGPSLFQIELRGLGLLIARAAGVLSLGVLAVNLALGRPLVQSLMFAVALAVGLTPELLPMITTVTLSRGAVRLSRRKVIVKRLASIHELGSMTVLCADKTGTLTSAAIQLDASLDTAGQQDSRAGTLAALCAALGGERGGMDAALAGAYPKAAVGWTALARLPFSYERRRGSVLARPPSGDPLLVCKGAPEAVLAVASCFRGAAGNRPITEAVRAAITDLVRTQAEQGLRCVAVATRACPAKLALSPADEADLVLEGFCTFEDPPKATAAQALERLDGMGVKVIVLSGDDPIIVRRVAGMVGLPDEKVLTGVDLTHLSDAALKVKVRRTRLFARLTPDQKVRVVRALQHGGEVVGFMGDGVNDAPAIRVANVGLSVDGATGVARAAADMVLLESDLHVVADGVEQGRRTFENVLKYIRMGASSNFGNMLSMAAASLVLPFLPLLAPQILLNNLLYDLSEVGIPFDAVDADTVRRPQRWSLAGIQRYALVMGPLSSLFDLCTFAVLLLGLHAAAPQFRTAWFIESITTQILVVFVIRTRSRWWTSRADPRLTATALGALAVAILIPMSAIGGWFGFERPSLTVLLSISVITAAYLIAAQWLKTVALGLSGKASPLRRRRS